ncbi:MAG TPA: polysaccharide deacetylase family protein [Candidatus Baltobacteraceae bacterium]|nr:polysaccharide deacetylase family protein [Candidatus Baltobacteraceae bacterium]
MTRAALIAIAVVALGGTAYGAERVLIGRPPPIPAVITTTMDSHRALSNALDARVYRFFYDRPGSERPTDVKLVALTFDDGPFPVTTPLLLDALHELHVPATFFLIGRDAEEFPELAARIAREGHEIGNHTLTHPDLRHISLDEVRSELSEGGDVLFRLTRDPSAKVLMRPPHGEINESIVGAAQGLGFQVIMWNDTPGDWRTDIPPEMMASHIERHATAPDIVLLHSGNLVTIRMLPEVVDRFRAAGYTFVTVGDLLTRIPPDYIIHPLRQPLDAPSAMSSP